MVKIARLAFSLVMLTTGDGQFAHLHPHRPCAIMIGVESNGRASTGTQKTIHLMRGRCPSFQTMLGKEGSEIESKSESSDSTKQSADRKSQLIVITWARFRSFSLQDEKSDALLIYLPAPTLTCHLLSSFSRTLSQAYSGHDT